MTTKLYSRWCGKSGVRAGLERLEDRRLMSVVLGVNAIVNPGAEVGAAAADSGSVMVPTGWTANGNATAVKYGVTGLLGAGDPGPAVKGSNYFAGGPAGGATESDLFQTIDATNLGAQIDTGKLKFDLSGYLGGLGSESNDATVFVNFQSASGGFVGQSAIGPVSESARGGVTELVLREVTGNVPTGTRKLQVQIHFESTSPDYTAAFADNVSLVLGTPSAIKLSETFTKLNLPASVIAGSKTSASATLKITNSGTSASTGTTVQLFASPDGTVASGTLITTFKQKVSVGAGKTATVSGPLVAIPRVSDGTYFIVAQVTDSSGGVTTVKFGTPVKIAAAKIDLVNNSVTVPATAKRGASVPIAISVTNVGNVVASGPLHIAISVSTFADGSNAIFVGTLLTQMNVKPGGTQTLHLTGKVTPGVPTGRLFLVADLDPTDLVGDVNLANNVKVSGRSILVS